MLLPLVGVLLLGGVATAGASIVTVVLMVNTAPLALPRLCGVLALFFGSSAAAVYCYGWLSVTLGGPFPALCDDRTGSGAASAGVVQEYWPLRSACVYADGATVEHVSVSVNVLVCLTAGLAVVLACAGVVLRRRVQPVMDGRANS
ncbi:hypothetical protein GCM10010293_12720 [Streptomyces griseoflavus]|uniref:hypothetical protein n=1 Tax=Streptomyces griseoflavus TaxID=35619 RepID=UPI00167C4B32|nr:hypothetical protein [Streptomyces griseoflavus]GGV18454.1 hypothetical protein GCM10010293_12720 [Streptomyces griseoflavus]